MSYRILPSIRNQ